MSWVIGTCIACDEMADVVSRLLAKGRIRPRDEDWRGAKIFKTAGGCWVMLREDGRWMALCDVPFEDVPQDGGDRDPIDLSDGPDALERGDV